MALTLQWWSDYLTRGVDETDSNSIELSHGCKTSDSGIWSVLCYSGLTGWCQVAHECHTPQHEPQVVKIVYYPTALEALMDNSIFPPNSLVWFS